jgi:hypothetical protein
MNGSERAQVLMSTRLLTSCGYLRASSCAITLPPEKPATWAAGTSSARSNAAASSAMVTTENGSAGSRVRPAPRLSKAVSR